MTLDKFPSFLAVVTFLALAVVVSHEWGYFGVIGLDFQSLYTTHDYIGLLIISIGPSFVILAVVGGLQIAFYRAREFKIQEPITAKSKLGRFYQNWYMEIIWSSMFIAALLFLDETERLSMYVLLALLSLRVVIYILNWPGFAEFIKSSTTFAMPITVLPGAMILGYGMGRDSAYSDLKDTKLLYVLKLKDQSESHNVKVLRLIDKGAILFDPTTKAVQFYQNESIYLLSKQAPEWENISFACKHFGWPCASFDKKN